jgi:hypothetical protein
MHILLLQHMQQRPTWCGTPTNGSWGRREQWLATSSWWHGAHRSCDIRGGRGRAGDAPRGAARHVIGAGRGKGWLRQSGAGGRSVAGVAGGWRGGCISLRIRSELSLLPCFAQPWLTSASCFASPAVPVNTSLASH